MDNHNTNEEVWKDVIGYEGTYQVSNIGRVKSLDRTVIHSDGKKVRYQGKILKGDTSERGYKRVALAKSGAEERFLLHRLILATFTGLYYKNKHVNHIDGDPKNNNLNNLEWCTPSENVIHAYKNNLNRVGDSHHKSKLTSKDVVDIRNEYAKGGTTYIKLAKMYNVNKRTIERVVNRTFWKHVK